MIPAEADICCPAEKVFDVITDFRGQDRWLVEVLGFPWHHRDLIGSGDPRNDLR